MAAPASRAPKTWSETIVRIIEPYGPYRAFIMDKYATLQRDLKCEEIVPILYQNDHITKHQKELIQSQSTNLHKNGILLDYLRSEAACKCFYEALEHTCQKFLQEKSVDGRYWEVEYDFTSLHLHSLLSDVCI